MGSTLQGGLYSYGSAAHHSGDARGQPVAVAQHVTALARALQRCTARVSTAGPGLWLRLRLELGLQLWLRPGPRLRGAAEGGAEGLS